MENFSYFLKRASLAVSLLVLSSCGAGSTSSGTANVIGSAGGSTTSTDRKATVQVPSGALSTNTAITIAPSTANTPQGNIGAVFDFGPEGTTFWTPVTITMPYDPTTIPQGITESSLTIAFASGSTWTGIPTTVDTVNKLLIGQAIHFSTYGVIPAGAIDFKAGSSPTWPNVATAASINLLPWGKPIGSFNGVIVYTNNYLGYKAGDYQSPVYYAKGSGMPDVYDPKKPTVIGYDPDPTHSGAYNSGKEWQCVEFVNRYYNQVYKTQIRNAGFDAKQYYVHAAKLGNNGEGLVAYPNGGLVPPQVGDILTSNGSKASPSGHVAIVSLVDIPNSQIQVVQQNYNEDSRDLRLILTMTTTNGVYTVGSFNADKPANEPVAGWLRLPASTQTIVPAPTVNPLSTPSGLAATVISSSEIDLSWNASTDVAATGYYLYRDGNLIGNQIPISYNATGFVLYSDTGLSPSTQYCYSVSASDASGNMSDQGNSACASTTASSPSVTNFSIGGTVTGLTGSVVLQDNGGDNLTVSTNGAITFPTKLTIGSAYSVTILTLPSGQTCAVTGGSGTATANVSSVALSCTNTSTLQSVSEGGLTWMPVSTTYYTYAQATALCAGTINGQAGWRLPTYSELSTFSYAYGINSSVLRNSGWWLGLAWSSDSWSAASHVAINLQSEATISVSDTNANGVNVTCVR